MTNLRKVIADVRKARYEGADKGQFVSGDVATGRVRDREQEDKQKEPEERDPD
jgi:hypothetical protein